MIVMMANIAVTAVNHEIFSFKQADGRAVVMEVNDTSEVDAGIQDVVLGHRLQERI